MDKNVNKVAQVVRRFTPVEWGGIESAVLNTSKCLQGRGIKSPIFCTSALSEEGEEVVEGIPVRRYASTLPWWGLSDEIRHQLELKGANPLSYQLFKALMKEKDLSLMHAHIQNRLGGIVRTVSRLRKIPYVVTLHGGWKTVPTPYFDEMQQPFQECVEWGKAFGWFLGSRRVVQDADAVICVSHAECEAIRTSYPDQKVFYLPNGIDVTSFSKGDPSLFRKKTEEVIILSVSRIDRQKNQKLLLEAFSKLNHPLARLVLIGPVTDPKYAQSLKAQIGNARVEIIEGLKPGDPLLKSAYHAANLFVLPSQVEPFGIVILEAWAAGLPVIASSVGGVVDFTSDERDVLHFDSQDVEGLCRQMERLISQPRLSEKLVIEGKKRVKEYDWKTISNRLLDIYREVIY